MNNVFGTSIEFRDQQPSEMIFDQRLSYLTMILSFWRWHFEPLNQMAGIYLESKLLFNSVFGMSWETNFIFNINIKSVQLLNFNLLKLFLSSWIWFDWFIYLFICELFCCFCHNRWHNHHRKPESTRLVFMLMFS